MESNSHNQYLLRKLSLFSNDKECKKQIDAITELFVESNTSIRDEDKTDRQEEIETKGMTLMALVILLAYNSEFSCLFIC
jgi:hypothetical protein